MLNGLSPVLIFNIFKRTETTQAILDSIPFLAKEDEKVPLQPIPIYLDEGLTGLYVDTETKSLDIITENETLVSGAPPQVKQKGLQSIVSVNLLASKNSIGITLLSAMADFVFEKVTSQEYSITYLHGPITIFNGLLHGFSIDQNSNDDLYRINIEFSRSRNFTQEASKIPSVPSVPNPVAL